MYSLFIMKFLFISLSFVISIKLVKGKFKLKLESKESGEY